MACWYIWWQCHEFVKGSNIASASSSAFTVIPKKSVWSKPSSGFYKLNVDASFFPDGTGGAGVVLHNSRVEVLAGS
jgi:hypothetical protein